MNERSGGPDSFVRCDFILCMTASWRRLLVEMLKIFMSDLFTCHSSKIHWSTIVFIWPNHRNKYKSTGFVTQHSSSAQIHAAVSDQLSCIKLTVWKQPLPHFDWICKHASWLVLSVGCVPLKKMDIIKVTNNIVFNWRISNTTCIILCYNNTFKL